MKYLFSFLMALSLLFLSCSKDTINTPEEEVTKNYGSLNFTIDKTTAPLDVATVKITLSRSDKPDITETMDLTGPNTAFINLKDVYEGNWHVKVDAYNLQNEVIYSGETDVTVIANNIVNLTITLNPVTGKLGIINITVNWGTSNVFDKWKDYGPVIKGGTYLQANGALQPSIIYENGAYKMWYTGMNNSNKNFIFYATSSDGIFWNVKSDPILSPSYNQWDSYGVGHPQVVKVNSQYFMYYRGEANTEGIWSIGLATSIDGINWDKKPLPVVTGNSLNYQIIPSEVVYVNNTFYLYCVTSSDFRSGRPIEVRLLTSTDGINFTLINSPIIGPSMSWEGIGIYSISILFENNKFKMIYNDFPNCVNIGYAESNDGIKWIKRSTPILIDDNIEYSWLLSPTNLELVKIGSEYRIYYGAPLPDEYTYKIGLLKQTF